MVLARYLAALVAVLAAPACGERSSVEGGRENGSVPTLTIYSGRAEPLVAPVLEGFEAAHAARVRIRYADSAQLAAAIRAEGRRSPADVFFAQEASTLAFLEELGVLAELPAAVLSQVPERFRSRSGRWIGVSGRARVLAYNPERVAADELPATVADLTSPRWRGRLGWTPENASFQSFVAAMIQVSGEDATRSWLEAMQANRPREYPRNTPAVIAVSRGEIDAALSNHYYALRLREEHGGNFAVENHYFSGDDPSAMVNLSGVAVLATSANKEGAFELVAHLLGPEAQAHFAAANHEFPLAAGATPPEGLPALETLRAPEVDLARLEDLETTVRVLRAAGVLR